VNFRSCGEDERHVRHSAKGERQEDESGGAFEGTRERRKYASDASDAKANLVEVVLHLEHALALGYSAGAPETTHKMTKTAS
jgi:hypothetical protein